MNQRLLKTVLTGLALIAFAMAGPLRAAPYAAVVIDARTGEVLHARNADTRLHPASLTKMMTLYIAFEAIKRGEISPDTKVKISRKAAAEQPSKLGLKAGQKIELRYLIRAAAVKSANDAATAIGEALEGSEAAFARRMNRTAKAMGMKRTSFKNAHGLTESGHLSTARDMTLLGRRLFYDHPEYYNLFSRRSTDAGMRQVANTNSRFLAKYRGSDGIKTGYTRAAGFNLVASAERGQERIIATMFGGSSTNQRNARGAELVDMGFKRAPSRAKTRPPAALRYPSSTPKGTAVADMRRSLRPLMRPEQGSPVADDLLIAALEEPEPTPVAEVEAAVEQAALQAQIAAGAPQAEAAGSAGITPSAVPRPRPERQTQLAGVEPQAAPTTPRVIARASTSGGRHWSISLGRYTSRNKAERLLLQTALQEIETLDEALRKVVDRPQGWEANFVGMSQSRANMACQRLSARGVACEVRGPGDA